MKALRKMSFADGDAQLCEVDEPICTENCVKVQIKFCGICGTDLHILHNKYRYYPPVTMGHEGAGIVVEIGSNVSALKVGDRVALLGSTMVQCGECEHCRSGMYMFCGDRRGMGHGVDGMFTKYVVVRPDQCYIMPEHMSFQQAALTEALGTAVQAVEEITAIHIGDVALITGPGAIGLMCGALLVHKGCSVILAGTETDETRLKIARRLGIQTTVNIQSERLEDIVHRETGGKGVDVAFETSGSAKGITSCLTLLKKTGKYIQVGINGGPTVEIPFDLILYKQLQLFGSLGHSLQTWRRMENIYKQNIIDLSPLITHVLPLDDWKEAFALCEEQAAVKVLLYHEEGRNSEAKE